MATLSITISDLPEDIYTKLKERAERGHRSVAQEISRIVSEALSGGPRASVMELHGLGRESWSGIDPKAYLDELRGTWD